MKGRILVINTGSTSTKIGFYDAGEKLFEQNLTHSAEEVALYESVMDQTGMRRDAIINFLKEKGIALYDTATAIRRLQDNASDKFLEVIEPTDIRLLLKQLPQCQAIVTTGQKATDIIRSQIEVNEPSVGQSCPFEFEDRTLQLYRMPSSSRAYPLALEKKAAVYRLMLNELGLLKE